MVILRRTGKRAHSRQNAPGLPRANPKKLPELREEQNKAPAPRVEYRLVTDLAHPATSLSLYVVRKYIYVYTECPITRQTWYEGKLTRTLMLAKESAVR